MKRLLWGIGLGLLGALFIGIRVCRADSYITVSSPPGGNLATDFSGVLPIANGGTNASSIATTSGPVVFDGTRFVTQGNMTDNGTTFTMTRLGSWTGGAGSSTGFIFFGGNSASATVDVKGAGSQSVNIFNVKSSISATLVHVSSGGQMGATAGNGVQYVAYGAEGDTDTGMDFPAANTLSFNTNLTKRMQIDSTGATVFYGADNATVLTSSISALQASIDGSDIFMSFNSNTGQEGSIAGTGAAGVLAYNTFTGAHWTLVDGGTDGLPMLTLLEATGDPITQADWDAVTDSGEHRISEKRQLVRSRVCRIRGSKKVMGFFGGHSDRQGYDEALALGTGMAWVANKGVDVEVGDLLMSSDVVGATELQGDDAVRAVTVAKARQSIRWKKGEKKRLIPVVYTCG